MIGTHYNRRKMEKKKKMCLYVYCVNFQFANTTENRTEGQGANCNRVIMFLTDGGTEMPEEVFQKYNADRRVSQKPHRQK